jgi:hypothetical protein
VAQRFCTRCGNRLEQGDLFCGSCGQKIRDTAADPDEPTMAADVLAEPEASSAEEEDLLADWDFGLEDQDAAPPPAPAAPPPAPFPAPDEAPTQAIAVNPAPRDTAVLPVQPEQAPYEPDTRPPAGPAAAPAPRERPAGAGFPIGATLALLGAVAVIVSSILDWGRGDLVGTLPRDITARTLIDPNAEAAGVNMGIVLLVLGTAGALLALLTMAVPFLKFLRRIVGLVTLAVPVLFVIRVAVPLFIAGQFGFGDVVAVLGPGFYFASAGALVQMIAGRWFGR